VFWTSTRDGRGFSFLAGFLHGLFLPDFQHKLWKKTVPRQHANLAFPSDQAVPLGQAIRA
jgi:hypothetical protein